MDVGDLSSNFNDLLVDVGDLSSNFNDLSSNFNDLLVDVGDLSVNFYNLSVNLGDLSVNLGDLSANLGDLSMSTNVLINDVNDISYQLNILDLSFITEISEIKYDIGNLTQIIADICGYEFLTKINSISYEVIELTSAISSLSNELFLLHDFFDDLSGHGHDLSFVQIFQNISDISHIAHTNVSDISNLQTLVGGLDLSQTLFDASLVALEIDISNLTNLLLQTNVDVSFLENNLLDLSNVSFNNNQYLLTQVGILNNQDVLIKTDINYNTSLIQNNNINIGIVNTAITTINDKIAVIDNDIADIKNYITDICVNQLSILADLSNLSNLFVSDSSFNEHINDISSSIYLLKEEILDDMYVGDILLKGDIGLANTNIEYNRTNIELLEQNFAELNDLLAQKIIQINVLANTVGSIDISNIIYSNSDDFLDVKTQDEFIKSDIVISNSNIEYNRTKIELLENDLTTLQTNYDTIYYKLKYLL